MTDYSLVKILTDSIVFLDSIYGHQAWTKVTLRKNNQCAVTGLELPKRSIAYRPVTNGYNRMERISEIGMNEIIGLSNRNLNEKAKIQDN